MRMVTSWCTTDSPMSENTMTPLNGDLKEQVQICLPTTSIKWNHSSVQIRKNTLPARVRGRLKNATPIPSPAFSFTSFVNGPWHLTTSLSGYSHCACGTWCFGLSQLTNYLSTTWKLEPVIPSNSNLMKQSLTKLGNSLQRRIAMPILLIQLFVYSLPLLSGSDWRRLCLRRLLICSSL